MIVFLFLIRPRITAAPLQTAKRLSLWPEVWRVSGLSMGRMSAIEYIFDRKFDVFRFFLKGRMYVNHNILTWSKVFFWLVNWEN